MDAGQGSRWERCRDAQTEKDRHPLTFPRPQNSPPSQDFPPKSWDDYLRLSPGPRISALTMNGPGPRTLPRTTAPTLCMRPGTVVCCAASVRAGTVDTPQSAQRPQCSPGPIVLPG